MSPTLYCFFCFIMQNLLTIKVSVSHSCSFLNSRNCLWCHSEGSFAVILKSGKVGLALWLCSSFTLSSTACCRHVAVLQSGERLCQFTWDESSAHLETESWLFSVASQWTGTEEIAVLFIFFFSFNEKLKTLVKKTRCFFLSFFFVWHLSVCWSCCFHFLFYSRGTLVAL